MIASYFLRLLILEGCASEKGQGVHGRRGITLNLQCRVCEEGGCRFPVL